MITKSRPGPKRLVNRREETRGPPCAGYPEAAQETAGPSKPKRRSRPMPDSLTRKAPVRGLPDPWVRGPIPYIDHANGRFSEVKFSWVKPGVRHVMAHPAGLKSKAQTAKKPQDQFNFLARLSQYADTFRLEIPHGR